MTHKFYTLAMLALAALTLTMTSCQKEDKGVDLPKSTKPVSVELLTKSLDLTYGEMATIETITTFENGRTNQSVAPILRADNASVAMIKGFYVIGLENGTTQVEATNNFYEGGSITNPIFSWSDNVQVNVIPETKTLTALEIVPDEIPMLVHGQDKFIDIYAVYADNTRKRIFGACCNWKANDNGQQKITYMKEEGLISAGQGSGTTELIISFTENGITKEGHLVISTNGK